VAVTIPTALSRVTVMELVLNPGTNSGVQTMLSSCHHVAVYVTCVCQWTVLRFDSTISHAVVSWGPSGPRYALLKFLLTGLVCSVSFSKCIQCCRPRSAEHKERCIRITYKVNGKLCLLLELISVIMNSIWVRVSVLCCPMTGWSRYQDTECLNKIKKPPVWGGQGPYKDCRATDDDDFHMGW
jgi:hypothetical protein